MLSRVCVLLAVGLAGISGCGPARLNSEISKTLSKSTPDATFTVPAVASERLIQVEVNSTVSDVDVYVVTGDSEKFLYDSYENRAKKALAARQKIKSGTLEATIPKDTEATVIIQLCDKGERNETNVTGRITGK